MKGSCLCGGVSFAFETVSKMPAACHCTQCRKTSGHYWAGVNALEAELEITGDTLTWYPSSEAVDRGFCNRCGSSLFWNNKSEDMISVAVGTLDEPHDLQLRAHIFVKDKGSYYKICEDEEQIAKY